MLVQLFGPHDCHSPITFRSLRSAQWDAPAPVDVAVDGFARILGASGALCFWIGRILAVGVAVGESSSIGAGRRCTMTNRIAIAITNTLIRLIARVCQELPTAATAFQPSTFGLITTVPLARQFFTEQLRPARHIEAFGQIRTLADFRDFRCGLRARVDARNHSDCRA